MHNMKAEKQIEEAVDRMCKQEPHCQLPVVFIFAPISEEFYSNYHTECRGQHNFDVTCRHPYDMHVVTCIIIMLFAVKNFLRCARRATEGKTTFSVVIHPMSIGNNDVSSRFCGNEHHMPWWICSGKENNR